jgi:hypothetical protein
MFANGSMDELTGASAKPGSDGFLSLAATAFDDDIVCESTIRARPKSQICVCQKGWLEGFHDCFSRISNRSVNTCFSYLERAVFIEKDVRWL